MFGPMITLLIMVCIIGVIAWALITYLPLPPIFRTVVILIAILICLVLIMRALGIALP